MTRCYHFVHCVLFLKDAQALFERAEEKSQTGKKLRPPYYFDIILNRPQ
jgi:hypothetical protein